MSIASDIEKIKNLLKGELYNEALTLSNEAIKKCEFNPILSILKSRCLQLKPDGTITELKEAKELLLTAHNLDPNNTEVLEELAFIFDSVFSDSVNASIFAKKLIHICNNLINKMNRLVNDL